MEFKILRWDRTETPEEGGIRDELVREGYKVFKWADSAGTHYPPHQHQHDESIWVLEGSIEFGHKGTRHLLKPGDRLFLPRATTHSALVPGPGTCFYLVGEKD